MPFLSVIIPVYKVEEYLEQCIESVLYQNLEDIEIILVDDGSPDKCPSICDKYSEKYEYIKTVHKKNGGLSSARNVGITISTGEYIIFMDSDDWWNPDVDMKRVLAMVENNSDIEMFLFSSLDYVEGKGLYIRAEHERLHNIRTDTVENYYEDLLKNGNLEVHAATKVLRRDFIIQNDLFFKSGITSEDNEWILRLLRVLNKVSIIAEPIYIYRVSRAGSITSTIGKKNIKDMLETVILSIEYYSDQTNSKKRMHYEYCFCAYIWFCALGLCASLSNKEYADLITLFQKTSIVCKYSNSPKTVASYKVYSVFGIRFTRFVLGTYLRIKHGLNINKKKQGSI